MNVEERVEQERERRTLRWWAGVALIILGALIAWALRFAVGYLLAPAACEVGMWVQWLTSGVFLLAGAGALALNLRLLRTEVDVATRFLAYVGIALNVYFLGVMLLETSALIFVDACAKGAIP